MCSDRLRTGLGGDLGRDCARAILPNDLPRAMRYLPDRELDHLVQAAIALRPPLKGFWSRGDRKSGRRRNWCPFS